MRGWFVERLASVGPSLVLKGIGKSWAQVWWDWMLMQVALADKAAVISGSFWGTSTRYRPGIKKAWPDATDTFPVIVLSKGEALWQHSRDHCCAGGSWRWIDSSGQGPQLVIDADPKVILQILPCGRRELLTAQEIWVWCRFEGTQNGGMRQPKKRQGRFEIWERKTEKKGSVGVDTLVSCAGRLYAHLEGVVSGLSGMQTSKGKGSQRQRMSGFWRDLSFKWWLDWVDLGLSITQLRSFASSIAVAARSKWSRKRRQPRDPNAPPEPAQWQKCHACHTKWRSMSPSATRATQNGSQCHACHTNSRGENLQARGWNE